MRWCFDAGQNPYADTVLASLGVPGNRAIVPILWRYEVSSVLARAEITGVLAHQDAMDFLGDIAALPIDIDDESASRILSDVHQVALTCRLTSYDAAYLELAIRRQLPLATLDTDLIRACKTAGVAVL